MGRKGKKISYHKAYETFKNAMTTGESRNCIEIPRYPVVARWRNDVDYVAAGIFCF